MGQDSDTNRHQQAQSPELPDGITAVPVTHYRVGPYVYSSLDDALAEHKRQSKT